MADDHSAPPSELPMSDEELDAYCETLPPPRDLTEAEWDSEADAAEARAEEDIAAGRVVSHEAVKRWIDSWGTPDPLPRPKWGE